MAFQQQLAANPKNRMDQTSPNLREATGVRQTFLSAGHQHRKEHRMPKFYVQSGSLEMVLQANDSRCAASWAAHRTLGQSLPFLCEEAADYTKLADLTQLGDTIRVSQRGFDRHDAVMFDTLDIVSEWNQLLVALDRLQAAVESAE
jgi:hypothetical protein